MHLIVVSLFSRYFLRKLKKEPPRNQYLRYLAALPEPNYAEEQMYTEMASRHRVRFPCIQIIKTATVPAKALQERESTKQFHNSKIKFPLVFRKVRPPIKTTYKASKPNIFM
ncbi:PREDICTED: 60S ribosomal protein L18a-2-like [Brassica oleracea var. oleracea]|uniref:Large ribosomal subunit protein eL20 domain-containing protein n=1 Tax=Brassica oleracea var. oleracea TaxID=109376 RepID=A0A0D3ADL7_BRAOL|nr:PREDICTED: 60S ribosomal protein L18a-2-like [Brassica oleracea var. oleracea]